MKSHSAKPSSHPPHSLQLTPDEISALFATGDWATKFPPFLSVQQAADLLLVPKKTIYDWRCRGLLEGCYRKVGRHLRFVRSRLVDLIFNRGLEQ
jgi:excisionase family DNA binding protein